MTAPRVITRQSTTTTRPLTLAERRVVNLLPSNLTTKQIGTRLGLTEHTVKSHLRRISARWGVQGRVALTIRVYELGLVPLPDGPELTVLRWAIAEITRIAATTDLPDRARPEVVVAAVRARLASPKATQAFLPPDWRTQIEASGRWSADCVIQLIEQWQARA